MTPTTISDQPLLLSSPGLLHPDGTLGPGWVRVRGGRIEELGYAAPPDAPDLEAAHLAPGFVDIHCHGGGGQTFATTDADQARAAAALHREHGTGLLVASLVSAGLEELEAQLAALVPLCLDGTLAGLHLEGPWLSERRRGAHDPALLRLPVPAEVARLVAAAQGHLAMVTLAPELPGALEAIGVLRREGVVVALGHTDADEAQFRAGVEAGARVVTHLCNGMRSLHHRSPGPVVAALADPRLFVELIIDGVHLHPEVAELLARSARSRVLLITDAMSAAGCGDGRYRLGSLEVDVVDGVARLADGSSIAGSTLTMDRAVRTALACGIPAAQVLSAATRRPAAALGLDGGVLRVGARTPVLLLDEQLSLQTVVR